MKQQYKQISQKFEFTLEGIAKRAVARLARSEPPLSYQTCFSADYLSSEHSNSVCMCRDSWGDMGDMGMGLGWREKYDKLGNILVFGCSS